MLRSMCLICDITSWNSFSTTLAFELCCIMFDKWRLQIIKETLCSIEYEPVICWIDQDTSGTQQMYYFKKISHNNNVFCCTHWYKLQFQMIPFHYLFQDCHTKLCLWTTDHWVNLQLQKTWLLYTLHMILRFLFGIFQYTLSASSTVY